MATRRGVIRERLRAAVWGFALHAAVQLVLVWPVLVSAAGTELPTDAIRGTITQVIRILEDQALKDPAKLVPHRRMLAEAIASRFDYAEMSRRALATYWEPLTTAERMEFVEVFKGFLIDRHAGRIEGYSGEQVAYLSERIEGTYAEVRTELDGTAGKAVGRLRPHRGKALLGALFPNHIYQHTKGVSPRSSELRVPVLRPCLGRSGC